DYARSLIAELMGAHESAKPRDFRDPEVCKHYLVGFCPKELFPNTKSDLGVCSKVHDEGLRKAFQASPDRQRFGYEVDFLDYLRQLCNDMDARIRRGQRRLNIEPSEALLNPKKDEREEQIVMLEEKIKDLLAKAEAAGEDGRVQEAQDMSKQADKLKLDLEDLKAKDISNPIFKQEKRMEVCSVCGGFLVTGDDSSRLDAHNEGKQHRGYLKIREAYED
ncbi:hypothetical protein BJ085DRAFT_5585, partial [Dimargaris cristalligena]